MRFPAIWVAIEVFYLFAMSSSQLFCANYKNIKKEQDYAKKLTIIEVDFCCLEILNLFWKVFYLCSHGVGGWATLGNLDMLDQR